MENSPLWDTGRRFGRAGINYGNRIVERGCLCCIKIADKNVRAKWTLTNEVRIMCEKREIGDESKDIKVPA